MGDELQQLKRGYQNITAPQHLQTRIRAEVADTTVRSRMWAPAAASLTAIVAILWIAPTTWLGDSATTAKPSKPSLSSLAALRPERPAVSVPSLARVGSVTVPNMPAKPPLSQSKNSKSR